MEETVDGDLPERRGCDPATAQSRPGKCAGEPCVLTADEAESWERLRALLLTLGYEELSAELAKVSETLAQLGEITGPSNSAITSQTCLSMSNMLAELSASLARRGEILARAEHDSDRQE